MKARHNQKENLWLSLLFNVVAPIFILSKLSVVLGPVKALLLALAFPLTYAVVDYLKRRQANPISILGAGSVLIKGIFALIHVDNFWFAVHEAAIPVFLGIFTIASAWFNRPLVNYFIYNENVFNIEVLEAKLRERSAGKEFKKLIWQITLVFGFIFFLGGLLNYILARSIIVSPTGTAAFNQELAAMTWRSYLVILLPKMIITFLGLWWFIHRLKALTGLTLPSILKE